MLRKKSDPTLARDGLYWEIDVGVTFASLMSATSLFFTGIIIAQYKSFDSSIKVPLIFLIISTYSFIFSATIFSNAGTEVTLNRIKVVEKYMIYAKNIEEFLGLYLFILATPMVVGAVTKDSFLRTTTIIIALTGITLYSQSKFSILQRELSLHKKQLLTILILVLSLLLYVSQTYVSQIGKLLYTSTAILLVLILCSITVYFSLKSRQYKSVKMSDFKSEEAESLSNIILKNLQRYHSARYSQTAIQALRELSSPEALLKLAGEKQIFVAKLDNVIAGFVCLDGAEISNVFTDPQLRQKGIGRAMVEFVEGEAEEQNQEYTEVKANKVDHGFYTKLGYTDIKTFTGEHGNNLTLMRKEI